MKVNHVIRTMVMSDFTMNFGLSLFSPIFAVFVTGQIAGATIQVVGFAAAITQVFKSLLQIPVAKYLDRNHGEYDDYYSMVAGSALIALTPFLYFFASTVTHVYAIQAIQGIGLALAVPPWFAIFSRHLDHNKENIEWSIESVGIGISGAVAAALSGVLAQEIGYRSLFLVAGTLALGSVFVLSHIYQDLRGKVPRGVVKPSPDRINPS